MFFPETTALNDQSIGVHAERVANIMPFIHQYNWKDINSLSGTSDRKKFERNTKSILFNALFVEDNIK